MRSSRLFAAYVVVMVGAIGGYPFLPDVPWLGTGWQVAIGWAAAAGTVVGVRRYRPPGGAAWLLFGAGVLLNASGIAVATLVEWIAGAPVYPSVADVFWLALYPCLTAGMVLIHRRRSTARRSTTLDAATITTGLGLLSWVFVIRPTVHDESLTLLGHLVVAAYPVGDIVILALVTRLVLSGAWRLPALRILIGALVMLLVGDVLWVVWSQLGLEIGGLPLSGMNMIFLTAFALVGAAALHPSMRQVTEARDDSPSGFGPVLLVALTVAALIGPAVLTIQAASGHVTDAFAIAVSSTVLFLLVVTRLAGLLRHVDAQARQLRELARTDALTGLPNRRDWVTHLPLAAEQARRTGQPLSIAMVDLDHFKRFNDEFGHPAGDRLLKSAAAAWQEQVRAGDILARYGGEEFIVLLPDADPAQAVAVIDRLRAATPLGQTFSAGVAQWDGSETSDELIHRADQALYTSKHDGRNRTTVDSAVCGRQV